MLLYASVTTLEKKGGGKVDRDIDTLLGSIYISTPLVTKKDIYGSCGSPEPLPHCRRNWCREIKCSGGEDVMGSGLGCPDSTGNAVRVLLVPKYNSKSEQQPIVYVRQFKVIDNFRDLLSFLPHSFCCKRRTRRGAGY
ncbi:hypothetical protein AVEN_33341-1 [Araneus ventricosus]|uniref:Uncharacterized protein n=1 Tax=Araneus ventricosus TaxID=182803 RepID=A0A4Y2WQA6_ARAVE|nr:hypothetical protein AVEN_33341-1 [Araneus ventricosus]